MHVVIGAAFGDEGKGAITHHLASHYGSDAVVVRFNGGAQAGHTVVTEDARRHVFKHVGSGTFAGAKTFLSQFFVSNPILFLEEIKQLRELNLNPKIYIDPDSIITTPYDMMINQMLEELRATNRHGSCGVGFSETIERNKHAGFSLKVADLEDKQKTIDTLQDIRKKWLPQRLAQLNIATPPAHWKNYLESDDIFHFFMQNLFLFLDAISISRVDLTNPANPVIFEGAQGLMLDQARGWFPHVTRSHTGLKNVIDLYKNTRSQALNVIYVTRSYLTRHGAGPLPHELSTVPYQNVIDKTNMTNPHQGHLRYSWFNLDLLKEFVLQDLKTLPHTFKTHTQMAVTCLDQADDQITFINQQKILEASQDAFLQEVAKEMQVTEMLCGYGQTREKLNNWQVK